MPTELPVRQELPPPNRSETGFRDLMIAATLLLSVLCLICEQSFSPTPGYSLAPNQGELQLSP
jgi:hypothetical protein